GPLVLLVDQSDSLGAAGRAALRAQAEQLAAEAGSEARVLLFGADVVVPDSPSSAADPTASDLAAALRVARGLLPGGGRVWLLSDGIQTSGDALAEAQRAAQAGLTIDVVPVVAAGLPEAAITGISAPRLLSPGEAFTVVISVSYAPGQSGSGELPAQLRLWQGQQLLAEQQVRLSAGNNSFSIRHTAGAPGVIQLRAELALPTGDTFAANNSAAATATITRPPMVLMVLGRAGQGGELAGALSNQGMQVSHIEAARLPARLADLMSYDGIVLVDVSASLLSLDQMTTLREFVRSEGHGLVATGGYNSFTLGGYKGTPLEDVLPVTMEPPPRPQRANVALLLIVDRSASMTAAFGVSKFDMAKEAAQLATDSLKADDRLGVLGFDTQTLWAVPFQQIGAGLSVAQIQEQIAGLASGGGTSIEGALAVGLSALAQQPGEIRHAVLLTDGRSFTNDYLIYQQLVETARAQGISLSTIAIGADSDTALLDQLAAWGGGRYYYAGQPEDIPRLTLLESKIAQADPLVEAPLRAELAQAHPILRDLAPADLPQLDGYVAVSERASADLILRSPEGDPLLAAWQYGLGRAAAWLPGTGAPWAARWLSWPAYERFWAQLVRYTLPDPEGGPIQVRLTTQSGATRLIVDAIQPGGHPLNLATVAARITLPDGRYADVELRQSAPGRYTQDLSLPDPGAYVVSVAVTHAGQREQRAVGYVQPTASEYLPREGEDGTQGAALLAAIAQASGGSVHAALDQAAGQRPGQTAARSANAGWPWLVGLALGLWVLEIAVRRGVLQR
ncbi:MAG: VWA domain-containing protein, partial [Oscillochloris sp.]|nr:VWA domain-containing protein [Oscillochloris sp.]